MTEGLIKFQGTCYPWSTIPCEDCPDLAVYLDLGNGRPEHIGYAEIVEDAEALARGELERLSETL